MRTLFGWPGLRLQQCCWCSLPLSSSGADRQGVMAVAALGPFRPYNPATLVSSIA
jgi:hypothetical protein